MAEANPHHYTLDAAEVPDMEAHIREHQHSLGNEVEEITMLSGEGTIVKFAVKVRPATPTPAEVTSVQQWLDNVFTYHAPSPEDVHAYERIRNAGREFAEVLVANVPNVYERAQAIDFIRHAVMWANAGRACQTPHMLTEVHLHGISLDREPGPGGGRIESVTHPDGTVERADG